MTTRMYGCSDDLIEFEGELDGEVYGSEEPTLIAFGDGTVAKCWFDEEGVWRITVLNEGTGFKRYERTVTGESDQLWVNSDRAWSGEDCSKVE